MASSTIGYGSRHRIIFDGDERKFELWEVKFMGFMKLRKLDVVLQNITSTAGDGTVDAGKNSEVFAELVQVLDDRSLSLIIRDARDDGRKAIRILRDHYLPKGKPRVITLYTELTSLTKQLSESVTDYIIRAETTKASLTNAGETIQESLLIAMILKGLPKEYQAFTTVVTQRETPMTFSDFKVALRNFEDTEKIQCQSTRSTPNASSSSSVMTTKSFPKKSKRWCRNCKSNTHDTDFCRRQDATANPSTSKNNQNTSRWCEICRSTTHDTKFCRKLSKVRQVKLDDSEYNDDSRSNSDFNHFAFSLDDSSGDKSVLNTFLVDSGATVHVVNEKSKFKNFKKDFNPANHIIELADGTRSSNLAKGQGDAKVIFTDKDGCRRNIILHNALYVPSFSQNIFSVLAATDNGASVKFDKMSAELTSNGTTFPIQKEGKVYLLKSSYDSNISKLSLRDWHVIFGHCNTDDLLKLEKCVNGMVITDRTKFDCEVCSLGKMTDNRSRKPDVSAKKPFDLVHVDLAGPIDPLSINDMKYAMICSDAFSGLLSVYFMKAKSDAPVAFKQYICDIAPYGKLKSIRADFGGEFESEEFCSILRDNHIKHEKSSPYSPHQNGKAERPWRTLFAMARCLLLQYGLTKKLWTYAVMAAAYIRNRCFNHKHNCTPFEVITGKRPNIANMKAFGTVCYALVQNPKKLDNRSQKCIFIGYDRRSPAYLVYFPDNQTIKRVRCVKFPNDLTLTQSQENSDELPITIEDLNLDNEEFNSKEQNQNLPETGDQNLNPEDKVVRNRSRPKHLDDYIVGNDIDAYLQNFIHYCYNANIYHVPQSYTEAISSSEASEWDLAMKTEMQALEENNTFELVPLPKGKNVIGSRWVYAIKTDKNGDDNYKARFVAKGYSQVEGVDYQETFSPTARMTSIRVLSQIAIQNDLNIHQMDVRAAYLNAPIDCDVYISQPEGFVKGGDNKSLVLKLKKSLYGLKQSGRNWNNTLDTYLKEEGFKRSLNDPCFYTRDDNTFIVHWVDDILIASKSSTLKSVKTNLEKRFSMKDLENISYFLGIEFEIEPGKLTMCQSRYISRVLDRFGMNDCKPRSTPCEINPSHKITDDYEPLNESNLKIYKQMVGSLIYIMTSTRPDIAYIVTKLSQFMSCANQYHIIMVKHVLRYLKNTISNKLVFTKSVKPFEIIGFSDSDWAGSIEDRKSITGYSFTMCENGPLISWRTQKQQTVALSSCEAEYMAMCSAVQEGKYLMSFLNEILNLGQTKFTLFCDNQGASALAKNPVNHKRSKHIDIKFHFIRDDISENRLCLKYIPSGENIADIFTKPVNAVKIKEFQPLLMGKTV